MDIIRVLGHSIDDATEDELAGLEKDIAMMNNGATVDRWKI